MEVQADWQSNSSLADTNLYMLDQEVACDVHFVCGMDGAKVSGHKYMLISRSVVFYTMFCGPLAEPGDTVTIPDIEPNDMKTFLRYLYTEDIEVTPDNVMVLMYAAKKYSVQSLVEQCTSFLRGKTSTEDLCSILEQAHLFDEKELHDQCFERILSKNSEVLNEKNTDILNLCPDCLKRLIKSDKLEVKEEILFSLCLKWSEEQCRMKDFPITDENQRAVLGDILFYIRFPNMSKDYFARNVSNRNILTDEEKILIFQYLHRPKQTHPDGNHGNTVVTGTPQFVARPRQNTDIHTLNRFGEVVGGTFDFWISDGLVDAISFSCSLDINLIGVSIFAPFPGGAKKGHVKLYDESFWCLACKDKLKIVGQDGQKVFSVTFEKVIKIEQGKWYTITQRMMGSKCYLGRQGQREIEGKAGAMFYFRKSPMDENNTSIESGQIPAILYN